MNDDALKELANSIVLHAADDYKRAILGEVVDGITPEEMKKDCEEFFDSEWFMMLSQRDPKQLARVTKQNTLSELIDKYDNILKKDRKIKIRVTMPRIKAWKRADGTEIVGKEPLKLDVPDRFIDEILYKMQEQRDELKKELEEVSNGK